MFIERNDAGCECGSNHYIGGRDFFRKTKMAAETRKEQIGFDAYDILKQAEQGSGAGRAEGQADRTDGHGTLRFG